uniref:Telomerase-binding protein EST1A n=1 Tax=Eptatretus burgeri TaxID=7764 RepID=A0A8C4PZQ6_EPTBU
MAADGSVLRVSAGELRRFAASLGPRPAGQSLDVKSGEQQKKKNRRPDIALYRPGISRLRGGKPRQVVAGGKGEQEDEAGKIEKIGEVEEDDHYNGTKMGDVPQSIPRVAHMMEGGQQELDFRHRLSEEAPCKDRQDAKQERGVLKIAEHRAIIDFDSDGTTTMTAQFLESDETCFKGQPCRKPECKIYQQLKRGVLPARSQQLGNGTVPEVTAELARASLGCKASKTRGTDIRSDVVQSLDSSRKRESVVDKMNTKNNIPGAKIGVSEHKIWQVAEQSNAIVPGLLGSSPAKNKKGKRERRRQKLVNDKTDFCCDDLENKRLEVKSGGEKRPKRSERNSLHPRNGQQQNVTVKDHDQGGRQTDFIKKNGEGSKLPKRWLHDTMEIGCLKVMQEESFTHCQGGEGKETELYGRCVVGISSSSADDEDPDDDDDDDDDDCDDRRRPSFGSDSSTGLQVSGPHHVKEATAGVAATERSLHPQGDDGRLGKSGGILFVSSASLQPGVIKQVPEATILPCKAVAPRRRGRGGSRRLWEPGEIAKMSSGEQLSTPTLQFHDSEEEEAEDGVGNDEEGSGTPSSQSPARSPAEVAQASALATGIGSYRFHAFQHPYFAYHNIGAFPIGQNNGSNAFFPFPRQAPTQEFFSMMPGAFYGGYAMPGPACLPSYPEDSQSLVRAIASLEAQLANLFSCGLSTPEAARRVDHIRRELLLVTERALLLSVAQCERDGLEQGLWKAVFHQLIERGRQQLRDSTGPTEAQAIQAWLLTILDEGKAFYEGLLCKLQEVYNFSVEEETDGTAIKPKSKTVKYALISAQRCMICLGDIARYCEQANDTANFGKARSWYLKAQKLAPKNGRPYNQLALLAIYTRRKMDAVYYYMRSLAASNPILSARESLLSLFEETKRKAEQVARQQAGGVDKEQREHRRSGQRNTPGRFPNDTMRTEVWIHPGKSRKSADQANSQDDDMGELTPSDLNKRFVHTFLHAHGKLFTRVGLETFGSVAAQTLQEFRALLALSPLPLTAPRLLQFITINMFAVHNSQLRVESAVWVKSPKDCGRSVVQELATALALAMFGLLAMRCTHLIDAGALEAGSLETTGCFESKLRARQDLRNLLPALKVWADWMLGHHDDWNPTPCPLDIPQRLEVDVWSTLAALCNVLAGVGAAVGDAPRLEAKPGAGLTLLILQEERDLAGFVPLLSAPQDACYVPEGTDKALASDWRRVAALQYFLEALCGLEDPFLAYKGGRYISVAPRNELPVAHKHGDDEDAVGNSESSGGDEGDATEDDLCESEPTSWESEDKAGSEAISKLRARKHALTRKVAAQERRREHVQAVLECEQASSRQIQLEIHPTFLVPDTNAFVDHLPALARLLSSQQYILIVPLVVLNELDGLARDPDGRRAGPQARGDRVGQQARAATAFLEERFEVRDPNLRALTSRGSELESIAFRSEDTVGQQGNNDDLILSCCLHYCKDRAKDFMPSHKGGPVRLRREVVLLTDDRNLRLKALTRHVPVREVPAFLSWARVA